MSLENTVRIDNIKNDLNTDDWAGMATLMDIEHVVCECIVRGYRADGCNLLTAFIRLTANTKSKRQEMYVNEVLLRLGDAERILAR